MLFWAFLHLCSWKMCACLFSCSAVSDSFVTPQDCSPPGSSVHGIFQARILEWVPVSYSRGSSQPRDQTHVSWVSHIGRWILYCWATWEAAGSPYPPPTHLDPNRLKKNCWLCEVFTVVLKAFKDNQMLRSHQASLSVSRPQALMGRFFAVKVKPHRSVCVQPHVTDDTAITTTLERVLEGPVWGMSDQLLLFLRER